MVLLIRDSGKIIMHGVKVDLFMRQVTSMKETG